MANELKTIIAREDALFEGCKSDTLLLIVDRSQDPITPLLNQWTYEAMVHELLGINNNRVFIENAPNDAQRNLVLSAQHDDFYANVRDWALGQLAMAKADN
jgi:vacuolar protein sorting-associated protein 45